MVECERRVVGEGDVSGLRRTVGIECCVVLLSLAAVVNLEAFVECCDWRRSVLWLASQYYSAFGICAVGS